MADQAMATLPNSFAGCLIRAAMCGRHLRPLHVEAHYSCKLSAEGVLEQYDLKRQVWFIAGYTRWLKQSTGGVHAEARARPTFAANHANNSWERRPEARDCNNELRRELLEARREEREAAAAAPPAPPPAPRTLWEAAQAPAAAPPTTTPRRPRPAPLRRAAARPGTACGEPGRGSRMARRCCASSRRP